MSFSSAKAAWESYFLKKLLAHVRPDRLYVISDTSADQNRNYAQHTKLYAVMPKSIKDTDIQPQSYVTIDDVRVMNLKCGTQREALYKFFTMWSHHRKLNVFFISQSFENTKNMKVNTNFLYLFLFTDRSNVKSFINTLFGGSGNKSPLSSSSCTRNYWTAANAQYWVLTAQITGFVTTAMISRWLLSFSKSISISFFESNYESEM